MKRSLLAFIATVLLLAGCASVRVVDNEVQSFSTLRALPTAAAFRFDRLPSQQTPSPRRDNLDRMVEQALSKVGLRRDDAAAHYTVQVGVRVQREDRADWPDPFWHWGMPGHRFSRFHPWSSPWLHTTPWYQREISLTLRDLLTGQVVYETHASQEGPWGDTEAILPAMFSAALTDFPTAPAGVRKINVEIPQP